MSVTLIGFPWDANSSFARGAAQGPEVIRSVLFTDMSSPYSLSGVNTEEAITHFDFQALPPEPEQARKTIYERVTAVLETSAAPISLGGDHSVSYPILKAIRDKHGPVNVLHIDAHTDLYDSLGGDRYSHACPFRRAIEDGCIHNLIQLGLRSITPDSRAFGDANGVVMLRADEVNAVPFDKLAAPLYVSIDLDGFDPAYAPGVSHPEPGGLSSRDVISLLGKLPASLVGADVVELNPSRDQGQVTALLAARLVKELTAIMQR